MYQAKINHDDCLQTYWGDCIHGQEDPKSLEEQVEQALQTCNLDTCDAPLEGDITGETYCQKGHQQGRSPIEEQEWKENQSG